MFHVSLGHSVFQQLLYYIVLCLMDDPLCYYENCGAMKHKDDTKKRALNLQQLLLV